MNIGLAYPSVPSFPQSSILLKRGKAGTALLQRQPWALFKLLLPSRGESPGCTYAAHNVRRSESSTGWERMDGSSCFSLGNRRLQKFYGSRFYLRGGHITCARVKVLPDCGEWMGL